MRFHKTWHLLHLIMTFLTGGFWIIIWIWRALANAQANREAEFTHMTRK